jgi:hypothetical protein
MTQKRKSNGEPPEPPVERNLRFKRNETEESPIEAEGTENEPTNETEETRGRNRTRE